VRRCSRHDRTVALIFFRASLLTAGKNEVKILPFFPRGVRLFDKYEYLLISG